jgi:hypothetical protein
LSTRLQDLAELTETVRCALVLKGALGITNSRRGKCMLDAFETLLPVNLTAYTRGGSLYSDLVAARFFSVLRASIGTMLAETDEDGTADDDAEEPPPQDTAASEIGPDDIRAALQRVIAGGGNFVFGVQWPGFSWTSPENRASALITLSTRAAVDTRLLGTPVPDPQVSYAGTGTGHVRVGSDNGFFEIFTQFKLEVVGGDNPLLSASGDPKALGYGQFSIGTAIADALVITYTTVSMGNKIFREAEGQLSITATNRLLKNWV